jgi:uncharacterized repeat protein (TIGR01451 family)
MIDMIFHFLDEIFPPSKAVGMRKLPTTSFIAPQKCRPVTGACRWLRAFFAIWLAVLATTLLLLLMSRLALIPVAHADSDPQVVVTKTIDPPLLISGEAAVISFTLSGVSDVRLIPNPLDVALVVDVSGSMAWATTSRLVTGTFVSEDAWEPAYTFTIEYPIADSMRVTATHPVRFVRHVPPMTYYTDTVDYDLQVSPVATGTWTVEVLRAGGPATYAVALYLPEHRLPAATYASKLFVDAISDTDQVAVVPFNHNSWVAQSLTSNRPAIHNALGGLVAGGNTRIDRGINTAHNELITSGHALSGSRRAMVVMSDGQQVPPSTLGTVLPAAQSAADDDIIIYTIGFGADADASTLMAIANIGCGRYYFAPDSQALQQIYQDIAHDLRGRAARSILIYDILPPGVSLITDRLSPDWSYTLSDGQTIVTRTAFDSVCIAEETVYTLPVYIDWEPGTSGAVNSPGSGITVTTLSNLTAFIPFTNPTVDVGGFFLDKQGPAYAYPGQTITYTLWLTNPSPVAISNVCLGDLPGPEATVISASHGGRSAVISDTEVWVWDLDTVAAGSVLSRTLTARIQESASHGTPLWNEAGVARLVEGTCMAPIAGKLLATDTWLTTIITAGLSANKVSQDATGPPLYPQDTLIYTVTVVNGGSGPTQTNVIIADSIPASTTFVAGSAQSNGEATLVGDDVIAQIDQLGPGQVLTLSFEVAVDPGTGGDTITNQALVASDQQPDPPQPGPTTDQVTGLVPGLTLNKWAEPDASVEGEAWTQYRFQITNTGDVALTAVQVSDDKLGFVGAVLDLPPGGTRLFTRSKQLFQDTHNVATATAQAAGFPGSVSATDDAYFDFIESPGLSLALDVSVQPDWIFAGQAVTYTYHLVNTSHDWMEEGVITDTLYASDTVHVELITSGLSLAPGASYTHVLTRWIAITTVNVARAWGTDRLGVNVATATDSAKVVVNPFGPLNETFIYLPVIISPLNEKPTYLPVIRRNY